MKKLLFALLALFACSQVMAQSTCTGSWCIADVAVTVNGQIVPGVPVGGTVTITVTFSSTVDQTGVTLGVSILDPSKTQLANVGLWQPGVNLVANQPLAGNSFTFTPSVPGTYTIEAGIWASDGTNPLWDPAVETFAVTAAAPTWTPILPLCLPQIKLGSEADGLIPIQTPPISSRYANYAVWVCGMPGGYQTYVDLFNPDPSVLQVIWNFMKGNWTLAQAQADCMQTCVQSTDSELAYMQTLIAKYSPVALVAFNGSNTTRSVYTTNADGTLNPTPIAGESIQVATHCDVTTRIPTASSYYSVAGQNDQSGKPFAAGTYAICVVSFPLAAN